MRQGQGAKNAHHPLVDTFNHPGAFLDKLAHQREFVSAGHPGGKIGKTADNIGDGEKLRTMSFKGTKGGIELGPRAGLHGLGEGVGHHEASPSRQKVIPASSFVIPAVIPAPSFVIPAKAGIQNFTKQCGDVSGEISRGDKLLVNKPI